MLPEFAPFLDRGPVSVPTTIIHGQQDTVVPPEEVHEIARKVFMDLTYHIVDDDHRLHAATDTLEWKTILS
jgi:pimeloyl-ACP methyl ester carboxylesterase